jgi:hypothetical protein
MRLFQRANYSGIWGFDVEEAFTNLAVGGEFCGA